MSGEDVGNVPMGGATPREAAGTGGVVPMSPSLAGVVAAAEKASLESCLVDFVRNGGTRGPEEVGTGQGQV